MSDIVTIGIHRDTLKALCALDAHTFMDRRAVFSDLLRDKLLSALIIELGRNEDEVTIRNELGVGNGAELTLGVLKRAGLLEQSVANEIERCGMDLPEGCSMEGEG